ncbi:sensor domain-containing diguanylate cyclase [Desulfopila sp. IMCC35008]|uniref:sensor domain-containing diguanylate cyclase n=1 Tax=Desulfopila sp. IMCC35008 TaxID=2653858 RepID=UPI0013D138AC|nr:sensor domain-containing diguanylate cyclase [Desulfopila sp. IMCC35008]
MASDDHERLTDRIAELENEVKDLKALLEKQHEEDESKYKRVIDSTSEGYLELDLSLHITDCNATILALLGKDKQTMLHKPIDAFYDRESVYVHFASISHLNFEADFSTSTQESIPLLCKRSIIRDSEGTPRGYFVFLTDVTELKKTQESLQHAQARYRVMYENAAQGMYQSTFEGLFLRVNPALARIFGFESPKEFLDYSGGVENLYKHQDDRQKLLTVLQRDQVVKNYEVEMVKPGGKILWVLLNARLTEDPEGKAIIEGILIDNTDKRFAEDRLRKSRERFRYLANHDNLTGLYNTRYLYKALDELITSSKEEDKHFSLVFLDMDNFKRVVDTYGHLNGSQALKEVARTLQNSLEEPAFGVAYGGDEFVLVLPEKGKDEAVRQIRRIRSHMKKTTYLENKGLAVHMSASFGVATFPDDAQEREGLLALADEAMFDIKTGGKDGVGTK